MEISVTNGQFLYDLCYLGAFFILGSFFLRHCHQKKYPLLPAWIILLSGVLFMIIGTKLMSYTAADWKTMFIDFRFPETSSKSALGGLAGGIFGIFIARHLLQFHRPVADAFAIGLPLAMAVQRVGCLIAGCCHGCPTSLPWGVSYPSHTHAYHNHLIHGHIKTDALLSLPVHPTQLYHVILGIIVMVMVYLFRSRFKRSGNLLLLSIGLLAFGRLVIEFWRDPVTNQYMGDVFIGLKIIQWILILAIFFIVFFIYFTERQSIVKINIYRPHRPTMWRLLIMSMFILLIRPWFTAVEFLLLEMILLPAMALQIKTSLENKVLQKWTSLVPVPFLFFSLISSGYLVAQEIIQDTLGQKYAYSDSAASISPSSDSILYNRYNEFRIGYGYHAFSQYRQAPQYVTGCSDSYYSPVGPAYQHRSNAIGLGYRYVFEAAPYRRIRLGGDMTFGSIADLSGNPGENIMLFDFSPGAEFDFKWIGIRSFLRAGRSMQEDVLGGIPYSMAFSPENYVAFSGTFRLFPVHIVYAELGYNDYFPFQTGFRSRQGLQIALGSGFGLKDGSGLEFGWNEAAGTYMSAAAIFKKKYGVTASIYNLSGEAEYTRNLFQFGLIYRKIE